MFLWLKLFTETVKKTWMRNQRPFHRSDRSNLFKNYIGWSHVSILALLEAK